jgi:hypothetical protein
VEIFNQTTLDLGAGMEGQVPLPRNMKQAPEEGKVVGPTFSKRVDTNCSKKVK